MTEERVRKVDVNLDVDAGILCPKSGKRSREHPGTEKKCDADGQRPGQRSLEDRDFLL